MVPRVDATARRWWFILIFQCIILSAWSSGHAAGGPGEHAGMPCQDCHFTQRTLAASGLGPEHLRKSQERACGECHQGAAEASHPSGFVPSRPLPAEFPLDSRGRMTCTTCHDFHAGRPGVLRVAKHGRDFCLSCHRAALFDRMPDGGHSIILSGHLDARSQRPPSPVDAYSFRCIECHNDNLSLPNEGLRVAFAANNATGMGNHPVGSIYVSGDRRHRLRVASALPRDVLLPEGRVSCLSCHQGYGKEHGALLRADRSLCMNCHEM